MALSLLAKDWETAPLTEDHASRVKEVFSQAQKEERARMRIKIITEGGDA